jgi:ATP-dependent DNA ligase
LTAAFPEWVEPMAATLTRERFAGPEWVFERKLDGIRLLAFKDHADVRLLSRNKLSQNAAYPTFVEAVAALPVRDVILDGEALGVWGRREEGKSSYHVFDILWLDGRDLMPLPLDNRRAMLDVAKRRDAPYEHRRSPHWLKMKCEATQELVVGGFTDPQGARVGLGALLVGYFDGDDFVFAGKVGTGFDRRLLLELRGRLDALEIAAAPFTKAIGLPRLRMHWVRPEVVVQVGFMEWTTDGKMRHPRLMGLRIDKAAREVRREGA